MTTCTTEGIREEAKMIRTADTVARMPLGNVPYRNGLDRRVHDPDPFLRARCQVAAARAVEPHSHGLAVVKTIDAMVEVLRLSLFGGEPCVTVPWAIADEPPLLFAHRLGQVFQTVLQESMDKERQAREARLLREQETAARKAQAHQERLEQIARNEAEFPSAEDILKRLRAGELVWLNQHNLAWDDFSDGAEDDDGLLEGDNPYGVTYQWSTRLTLESVKLWRQAMVRGKTLGACPPGGEDDCEPPEPLDDEDYYVPEDDHEVGFEMLFDARIVFGPSTRAVIPAKWSRHPRMRELLGDDDWVFVQLAEQDEIARLDALELQHPMHSELEEAGFLRHGL